MDSKLLEQCTHRDLLYRVERIQRFSIPLSTWLYGVIDGGHGAPISS